MVPKKFEYQPVRRDETELVQKPVVEVLEKGVNIQLMNLILDRNWNQEKRSLQTESAA